MKAQSRRSTRIASSGSTSSPLNLTERLLEPLVHHVGQLACATRNNENSNSQHQQSKDDWRGHSFHTKERLRLPPIPLPVWPIALRPLNDPDNPPTKPLTLAFMPFMVRLLFFWL